MSSECQQLNRLFSQCVDGARIKVPPSLEDPPPAALGGLPFILDLLHEAATTAMDDHSLIFPDCTYDMLDLLACRDSVAMSEFELIQLVIEGCRQQSLAFDDFVNYFDYSRLSNEEKAWVLSRLPPARSRPSLVMNGLLQSQLVSVTELRKFGLHHHNLHWKPIFSHTDHMSRFLDCTSRALELFHKKLIIIRPDERLTIMIIVPYKVEKAAEVQVDDSVRVLALPRSSDGDFYAVSHTKITSNIYCDDGVFQLYEGKRANTFVYLTRGAINTAVVSNDPNPGERRRQRHTAVEAGKDFECRASVALQKISAGVQKHIGRLNWSGIMSAEIFVISNRDVESMHYIDQWLEHIDTEKVLPLFETIKQGYRVSDVHSMDRKQAPPRVARMVWDGELLSSLNGDELTLTLRLLMNTRQMSQVRKLYLHILEQDAQDNHLDLLRILLEFLSSATFMTEAFLGSKSWRNNRSNLVESANYTFFDLLRQLVLSVHTLQAFVQAPFKSALLEMTQISVGQMVELAELVALCVEEPEFALDLLLDSLQSESQRLLVARPTEIQQILSRLVGITIDHIDEASAQRRYAKYELKLGQHTREDGQSFVKGQLRIDLPHSPMKSGDHIRFITAYAPSNAPLQPPFVMDTVVHRYEQGSIVFRCIQNPPPFLADCSWRYRHCGSFVTSKVMLDSINTFYSEQADACELYDELVSSRMPVHEQELVASRTPAHEQNGDLRHDDRLNASQNRALSVALRRPLVFLWGPPGTGKTQTIVVILEHLLQAFPESRLLVTAPTHNAVDNLLQRFLEQCKAMINSSRPLRMSTNVRWLHLVYGFTDYLSA